MTEPRKASLAFLTAPAPGVFLLNLQFETGEQLSRVEISKAQLANIIADGAAMAFRESTRLGPESLLDALEGDK